MLNVQRIDRMLFSRSKHSSLSTSVWRRGWAFEVARTETARAPTEGASPLVCFPRRGHIPRDPPCSNPTLGTFMLSHTLTPTLCASRFTSSVGGEGGIRTHGPIAGTHAFQACRFDHSRTSPRRFSRGGILTRGLMTGKVSASAPYSNPSRFFRRLSVAK